MKRGKSHLSELPPDDTYLAGDSLQQKAEGQINILRTNKKATSSAGAKRSQSEADTLKLIHELEVHQMELELQNEELREAKARAEFEAEQYADLYEEIYDFSPVGYFTITPEGTICELNYNGAGMLGKARYDLVGSNFRLFISQATLPVFNDFLNKVFSTNSKQTCEVALSVFEEQDIFVHIEGMVTRDGCKCLLSLVNITALKKSEEALRFSEQGIRLKLETILSPTGNPEVLELADIIDAQAIQSIMDEFYSVTHIGVGLIDLNGKVLVANGWQDICTKFHRVHPETCRNCIESDTKLTLGSQLGSFNEYNCMNNMWDIFTPIIVGGKHLGNIFLGQFLYDDETPDFEAFREQARKFGFDEAAYMDALDRVPRWSRETVKSVMSFYSRLSTLISNLSYSNLKLAQTIEERNRAAEELRNNYSLLRIAGEMARFGGWSVDLIENKLSWSDEVATIHEVPAGNSYLLEEGINFYAPEYRDQITRAVSDCIEKGISYDMELELITAKGNRVWVRTAGEAVRAENGKIIKIQGAFQDITERKRTEQLVVEGEANARAIMESTNDIILLLDKDGTVIDNNEGHAKRFGLTRNDLIGKNIYDFLPEDVGKRRMELVEKVIATGQPYYGEDLRDDRLVEVSICPIILENEIADRVAIFAKDITDRRRIEDALQKSRDLFSLFMNYSPVYTYIKEVTPEKSIVLKASDNYRDMVGISGKEMEGKSMEELFPVEFAAKITADDWAVISGGEVTTLEEELNGRSYTTIKFPISQGDKNLLAGYTIDITDQKTRERELRESEARFRSTFDQSPVGSVMVSLDSRFIKCNASFCDFIGYSEDELIGKTIADITYPEDRELGMKEMKQLDAGKKEIARLQKRYVRKDGNVVWGELSICVVCDADNKPIYFLPIIQDITERKQIETELAESEARFRNLLQAVHSVSVQGYAPDGTTQYWNKASEVLYGYTAEEAIGRNLLDLIIPPEMKADVKLAIQQMAETGQAIPSSELSLMRRDGSYVSVFSSHAIVKIPGRPQELFCIDVDLTELKQAEIEILKSKQQYDNLVSKIPVGVYILKSTADGAFALEYVSPRMAEMLGLSVESLLGHNETIYKAIHPDDLDGFIRLNQEGIQKKQPFDWKGRVVVKGNVKWLNISSSPQQLESGNILWHGLIVNITERMRYEAEIKLKNDELIQLNATKDKFFSIIAHDLKSPFNSILGFSNLLESQIREKDFEKVEEYAKIIQTSSVQAMDLLMNLLEWSRSQTGRMVYKPENLMISQLISQATDLLKASAQQKSITISTQLPKNISVFADKTMIGTILRNLISNAIKFTHNNGKINVSAEQKEEELMVCVSDNGVGIKPNEIEKLFRIDENRSTLGTQNEKGTGLGLILCKEFIEKHGGKIWVESTVGKGSNFYFTIPNN